MLELGRGLQRQHEAFYDYVLTRKRFSLRQAYRAEQLSFHLLYFCPEQRIHILSCEVAARPAFRSSRGWVVKALTDNSTSANSRGFCVHQILRESQRRDSWRMPVPRNQRGAALSHGSKRGCRSRRPGNPPNPIDICLLSRIQAYDHALKSCRAEGRQSRPHMPINALQDHESNHPCAHTERPSSAMSYCRINRPRAANKAPSPRLPSAIGKHVPHLARAEHVYHAPHFERWARRLQ